MHTTENNIHGHEQSHACHVTIWQPVNQYDSYIWEHNYYNTISLKKIKPTIVHASRSICTSYVHMHFERPMQIAGYYMQEWWLELAIHNWVLNISDFIKHVLPATNGLHEKCRKISSLKKKRNVDKIRNAETIVNLLCVVMDTAFTINGRLLYSSASVRTCTKPTTHMYLWQHYNQ